MILIIEKEANNVFSLTYDGGQPIRTEQNRLTTVGDFTNFKTANGANLILKQNIFVEDITVIASGTFNFTDINDLWNKLIEIGFFDGVANSGGGSVINRFDELADTFDYFGRDGQVVTVNESQLRLETQPISLFTPADRDKLDGIQAEADVNVQADASITDPDNPAYIKNFPNIPNIIDSLTWIKSNESISLAQRNGDFIYGILDQYTGEEITLKKTTDTNSVDGVIYFELGAEKFKRNYADYADPRWFGAKADGVDLGIGDFTGDQDAINQALLICNKVILKGGTFLCKRPIYLNSGNELLIDEDATLKLGMASNCTFIKNRAVDFYKDGQGNATYPDGFVRDKNIKLHGKGKIDFNGWFQNRADSAGGSIQDNPLVVGTPRFPDGTGIGSYYTGVGAKFADIDDLFIGGGLTVINARTYTIYIGGIRGYIIDDLTSKRSYYVQNQDFFDINGGCYDGVINNVRGNSGDEFIVLATTALGDETLRNGDIKRLKVSNISYYGVNPSATPTSQTFDTDFEDDYPSHRLARVSYTRDYIVDDIVFEDCYSTKSKLHAQIVVSKLPYSPSPNLYSGNGYIGNLTFRNVNSPNQEGLLDFGDFTLVKNLTVENIVDRRFGWEAPRGLIANYENFTGEVVDFTNSKIENFTLNNVHTIIGGDSNPSKPYIDFAGEITRFNIDNYSITTDAGFEDNSIFTFIKSNVKLLNVSNSSFARFNKIFDLSNIDCGLFENNSAYKTGKDVEDQIFSRVNSNTFVISTDDIISPFNGDIVRTSLGLRLFNGTFWQGLNKPTLTNSVIPIQGIDDLENSDISKEGEFNYNFGSPTKTNIISVHKSAGFFGETTPFIRYLYEGFNLFKSYMDGSFNTVFESIQRGTEQSGIRFVVNALNVLTLKKDGNAYFDKDVNVAGNIVSPNLTGVPTAPTATEGTNTPQIATTAFVLANSARPYKVYTALLTQSGTNAPIATVLENTLGGTVVWSRVIAGRFRGTLTNGFVSTKTIGLLSNGGTINTSPIFFNVNYVNVNEIEVTSYLSNTSTDGLISNSFIEIRVYN